MALVSILVIACAPEGGASSSRLAGATLDIPGGDGVARGSPGSSNGATSTPRTCPSDRWCSQLYAPTWSASAPSDPHGRFLHDFSFAGYRYGEAPPSAPPGETYDVVAGYGVDPSGQRDATPGIQAAIDAAAGAGGGVVYIPEGDYRVDGTLTVADSGVVIRGAGKESVLRFTKKSGMEGRAHVTFAGSVSRDVVRLLAEDAPIRATELRLTDARDLAPGDDVSVGFRISADFVAEHGMTDTWRSFEGEYKTFFRRKVVSVDRSTSPHKVVIDVPLRYEAKVRDGAGVQKERGYLREVGIEHLAVSDAVKWSEAWAENRVHAVALVGVADAWVLDVHSVATPGATGHSTSDKTAYHLRSNGVLVASAKRVSVLGSSMENAQNRGAGGNGYLFEVSATSEVLFADSIARRGRHNFIQNWGFGNSGTVFLRCISSGSELLSVVNGKLTPEKGYSEHHHSLAMATLVDSCRLDDGCKFENRGAYSEGAGHTGTGSVVWRASGAGTITSRQFGWGYVIGTDRGVQVETDVADESGSGTAPEDFVEGRDQADSLFPSSLYEDQRDRRLGAD